VWEKTMSDSDVGVCDMLCHQSKFVNFWFLKIKYCGVWVELLYHIHILEWDKLSPP